MSDKFLNSTGLATLRDWVLTKLGLKMDKVSSPTSNDILTTDSNGQAQDSGKTIDNIDNLFVAVANGTTYSELYDAIGAHKYIVVDDAPTGGAMIDDNRILITLFTNSQKVTYAVNTTNEWTVINRQPYVGQATDSNSGTIKTNSAQSITLDNDGKLTVGGRLGQYPDGGVFYPTTIDPTGVGGSSFLMTDGAKGLNIGGREFAIMAGASLNIKSAAAGSTTYRASNTQANRILCAAAKNGFCAIDQTDATTNGTAKVTDISFANGDPISFYFGATESTNDIIITVDRTVNPSSATTKLRMYGNSTSGDVIAVGQGVGGTHGKAIVLGQSCFGGGNQIIALGNGVHVMANNSSGFGHTHLVNKQFCFAAGQGHDFTNGSNGASAFGVWSKIDASTAFAVGSGTAFDNRKNAFEVTKDGGIIVPSSTAGSTKKFKITVDDSGNLSATAL